MKEHLSETEAHNLIHLSSVKICHFSLESVRCEDFLCLMSTLYIVLTPFF